MAAAMRMPPRELKILRVSPAQFITDVVERQSVAGVIVGKSYLYAHHKVELLVAFIVRSAVSNVRLGNGKSACILVRRAIHSLSGVELRCTLG